MVDLLYPPANDASGESVYEDKRGSAVALTSADMGKRYIVDDDITLAEVSVTEFGREIVVVADASIAVSGVGSAVVNAASPTMEPLQMARFICLGTNVWAMVSVAAGESTGTGAGGGATAAGTLPSLTRSDGSFNWLTRAISSQAFDVADGGSIEATVDVASSRLILGLCTAGQRSTIAGDVQTASYEGGELSNTVDNASSFQPRFRRFNTTLATAGTAQAAGDVIGLTMLPGGDTEMSVNGATIFTWVNDVSLAGAIYSYVMIRNSGQSLSNISATGLAGYTWDPAYSNLDES